MKGSDTGGGRDALLQQYLDGRLDGERRAEVERLLAADPGFARALADYRAIGGLLREAAGVEEASALLDARLGAVKRGAAARGEGWRGETLVIWLAELLAHRKRVWIPAAAAAAAAVAAIVLLAVTEARRPPGLATPPGTTWSRVTALSLGANIPMVYETEDEAGTKATILWIMPQEEDTNAGNDEGKNDAPAPDR